MSRWVSRSEALVRISKLGICAWRHDSGGGNSRESVTVKVGSEIGASFAASSAAVPTTASNRDETNIRRRNEEEKFMKQRSLRGEQTKSRNTTQRAELQGRIKSENAPAREYPAFAERRPPPDDGSRARFGSDAGPRSYRPPRPRWSPEQPNPCPLTAAADRTELGRIISAR